MTKQLIDNPSHWHNRAEEARTRAEQLRAAEPRRLMLEIAADYERLAENAEQRLRSRR